MVIKQSKFVLRNGTECVLRSPAADDAETTLSYLKCASGETEFMLRYPEEIRMTAEEERAFLSSVCESPDRVMLGAFIDGRLIGNASLFPAATYLKTRHRAEFGIAVLKEYCALGLGRELITRLIETAPSLGFTQIELDVLEKNTRAISLYESLGFTVFGKRENGFRLKSGESCSELLMYRTV